MPKFFLKKLENNLTLLFIQTQTTSLDITFYINVGSANEHKKNNGISHLLEHLLFLKTKQSVLYPVGLDIYPHTRKDFTYFEITTHKSLLNESLSALSSVLFSPNFNNNNLKTIKKIAKEELREFYGDPYSVLNQQIDQFLYQNNSLALNIGGDENLINNITISNLKEWYNRYYQPENMVLTIAGNVNITKTIKEINRVVNKYHLPENACYNEKIDIHYPKAKNKPITLKSNADYAQTYIAFVFPVVGINHPNYIPCVILAEMLNKKIRYEMENSGLFYDIELSYHQYMYAGEFRIITACQQNHTSEVLKKINDFVQNVIITSSFFKTSKEYIEYQWKIKEDYVDELSSLSLYLLCNQPKLITLQNEIEIIKNTQYRDINEMKKKYFHNKNMYTFIMN